MCGIAGLWRFGRRPVTPETALALTRPLTHRGPDDCGHLLLDSASGRHAFFGRRPVEPPPGADLILGQRRLSIIDLSEAGRQPLANEDRTVWAVVNGEIYNFRELRGRLERAGHHFRGDSDSEVVVHLYEERGPDFLEDLEGMFALAVWDGRARRLVLARDRAGKKPLWLAGGPGWWAFASELKALCAAGLVAPELDYASLDQYLAYGYVPSPRGILAGCGKIRPAERAVIEADGRMDRRPYWRLSHAAKLRLAMPEAAELVRRTVQEAVARRLEADVPLGAFLSGGLDSSLVVALMSRLMDRPVKTFSVGFGEPGYDELEPAAAVARHCGAEHTEIMVRPELTEALPELAWLYGEPFADSSALPTYYLAKETRRHVTVALNGDGGDESFWGYRRYQGLRLAALLRRLPRPILAAGGELFRRLADSSGHERGWALYGHRLFAGLAGGRGLLEVYLRWHGLFSPEERARLYTPELARVIGPLETGGYLAARLAAVDAADPVERFVAADAVSYLPEDLLVKVDIATMAVALEARSPLLDRRVMELAASLPPGLKLAGRTSKAVLKRAAEGLLPPEIIHRSKMGFGLPIGRWFRGELRPWLRRWLLDGPLAGQGWFDRAALEDLEAAHAAGRADHTNRLWALLFLAHWHDRVLSRPAGGGV